MSQESEGTKKPETCDSNPLGFDVLSQIRELQAQNTTLLSNLDKKERECERLKAELAGANEVTAMMGGADGPDEVKSAKILELAKKNRTMNVKLEGEKTKSTKLQAEVNVLKQRVQELEQQAARQGEMDALDGITRPESVDEKSVGAEKALKEYKTKYEQTCSKLNEFKLQVQQMKNETAKLKQALTKELGEETPIAKALEEGASWRGRAQQIALLKTKNRELKRDLELTQAQLAALPPSALQHALAIANLGNEGGTPRSAAASSGLDMPTTSFSGSAKRTLAPSDRTFDDQHKEDIEKIEVQRRKERDVLEGQLQDRNEEIAQLKKKAEASIARIKNLETYSNGLKSKIQVLLEKSQTDDQLIATMRQELQDSRKTLKSATKGQTVASNFSAHTQAAMDELRRAYTEQCEQLRKQDELIAILRADLKASERKIAEECGGGSLSAPGGGSDPFSLSKVHQIEAEKMKEIAEMYKEKLAESERSLAETQSLLRQERMKGLELERKVAIATSDSGELLPPPRPLTTSGVTTPGREKSSRPSSAAPVSSSSSASAAAASAQQIQALNDKLLLQMDENQAIKASLRSTQQTQETELRLLREMLETQKESFENAIASLRQQQTTSESTTDRPRTGSAARASSITPPSTSCGHEGVIAELTKSNETLKRELSELKKSYNAMMVRMQNKK